ncbi:hypothetical protein [Chroococcidiopsis sp.]|uniref:hypothetical protein n=1 Tax=Chroococcidiopsis sp. TaxID=3088168 RepID=UPI003F3EB1AF
MTAIAVEPIFVSLDSEMSPPRVELEAREIEFIACKEQKIVRYDWFKGEKYFLTFSHAEGDVDLSRVSAGQVMFLDGHTSMFDSPKTLGQVREAKLESGELHTLHVIGGNKNAEEYWNDVQRKVIPGVSMEANVTEIQVLSKAKYEETEDVDGYRRKKLLEPAHLLAKKWQLLAVSSVSTPAIIGAGKKHKEKASNIPTTLIQLSSETGYEWLEEDTPTLQESEQMTDQNNDRTVQLADENRDLKIKLSTAEKLATEAESKVTLANAQCEYWKLRCTALSLYAVDNKLSQEEFELDFSEDPKADIDRLSALSKEDVQIELKTVDRALRRASLKKPVDRVSDSADRTMLENKDVTVKKTVSETSQENLSDRQQQEKEAEEYMAKRSKYKR